MSEKECVFSRGLKRHATLKHVQEAVTPKNLKKEFIAIDEFMNIMKRCEDSFNENLCLPEDTRKLLSLFDFTPDDSVELWAVLKPVVERLHGNAENCYSDFFGLLQENLLPKKFGDDITLANVLLPEVTNHVSMHLSTMKVHYDNLTIKYDSAKLSKKEFKSLQYIVAYAVHKLYCQFKFSKNRYYVYSKQSLSILLCCKIDSDDTQISTNAKDRGGLWRVNETVHIEYFALSYQHFA